MSIEWSPQQAQALDQIGAWMNTPKDDRQQVFYLAGYAGTGKSTLAKYLGDMEKERRGYAQYCALTGKAALVLKRKGCINARTIHSTIYTSHDRSQDDLAQLEAALSLTTDQAEQKSIREKIADEKENLKRPAWSLKQNALDVWGEDEWGRPTLGTRISLFIVDECSMVDKHLGEDLMSFGAPILVLGDPAQLPPVAGNGFFTSRKPDVLLTEIHRQAAGNPIIEMASAVRQGQELALGAYGDSRVVTPNDLRPEEWVEADQILVGRNETRFRFNRRMRQVKGFSGLLPQPGERLVCLRNNHEIGLLNGGLWTCLDTQDDPKGQCFNLHAKSDDEDRTVTCQALKFNFIGGDPPAFVDRKVENEFTFGYALTCHKAQGSQWNNVIYYDEWNWNGRKEHVYTGITRAAERVTVVRP